MRQNELAKTSFQLFLVAVILTLPFFIQAIALLIGYPLSLPSWIQLILATAVQVGTGWIFYLHAYRSAIKKKIVLDTLIALGTTAAYSLSLLNYFSNKTELYFTINTIILTFALLGKWLNHVQNSLEQSRSLDHFVAQLFPFIAGISLLTWLGWGTLKGLYAEGFIYALSVFMVSCPATAGFALPFTISIARTVGSRHGVIFKEFQALQQLTKIKALFFDNRGTLTEGIPFVQHVQATPPHSAEEILSLAASLEIHSNHPFAQAILNKAKEKGLMLYPVEKFEAFPGEGISGYIQQTKYHVGSLSFTKEFGITADPDLIWMARQGQSLIALWSSKTILGYIGLIDQLRSASTETIEKLKEREIEPVLLTSDQQDTAFALARSLDIQEVKFDLLPSDKIEEVALAKQLEPVGVVGNLLFSSPILLNQANVSLALGPATEEAVDLADIVLDRNDLLGVIDAIKLAWSTARKIKLNLFFSFIYNLLAIPLAAAGLINPLIAVGTIAMGLISIIANTLLLHYWKSIRDQT